MCGLNLVGPVEEDGKEDDGSDDETKSVSQTPQLQQDVEFADF